MLWFIFHKPQDIVVLFKQESRHFFWNIPTMILLHRISKIRFVDTLEAKFLGLIIYLRGAPPRLSHERMRSRCIQILRRAHHEA